MPSLITDALQFRYATKHFDPSKKISDADWKELLESFRMTASSYGLQPWKFIVVESPELRKKLTPISWGQPQIEACSHLVVLTHLKKMTPAYIDHYLETISEIRHTPIEKLSVFKSYMEKDLINGPRASQISDWASRQVYIAMGTFLLAAALKKIDTCPIEGIEAAKYDEALGLTITDYQTVAVIAAGYRSADDASQNYPKVRFSAEEVIQIL